MNTHDENEIKKEFQLERIIFFSDAVFAIIITIMVLDIRLPEGVRQMNAETVKHVFLQLFPKVLAYGLSFFLVSQFWRSHLKMFSLLKDYDGKLLTFNLVHLFSVSLFPFAITLISGNLELFAWGGYTYVGIFLLCTFSQTLLAHYLMKHRQKLCFDSTKLDGALRYKVIRLNFIFAPVMIFIMVGLDYFSMQPIFAIYLLAIYGITISRLIKRYYPEKSNNSTTLSKLFRKRKGITISEQPVVDQVDTE